MNEHSQIWWKYKVNKSLNSVLNENFKYLVSVHLFLLLVFVVLKLLER